MDPLKLNWKKVGGDRMKLDTNYAKKKLRTLLRDVDNYNCGEFWRQMSRIACGATGRDHAEELEKRIKELELNAGLSEITLDFERRLLKSCESSLEGRDDRIDELEGQLAEIKKLGTDVGETDPDDHIIAIEDALADICAVTTRDK